jgi:hypothetical protein
MAGGLAVRLDTADAAAAAAVTAELHASPPAKPPAFLLLERADMLAARFPGFPTAILLHLRVRRLLLAAVC